MFYYTLDIHDSQKHTAQFDCTVFLNDNDEFLYTNTDNLFI